MNIFRRPATHYGKTPEPVDRLFGAVELRLGSGNRQQVVRIVRINPTQAAAAQPASVSGDTPS